MAIKTVLLIGAGGSLGAPVLTELQKQHFTVTVLTRESSNSTFPSSVKVVRVPDDYPEADLVAAFQGQDAVVNTISTVNTSTQDAFVDAAVKAGVKRFIPAEFGTDAEEPELAKLVPVWAQKNASLEYIKEKAAASGGAFSWTAIQNGAFFDWAFTVTKGTFWHLDLNAKKMLVFDDGNARFAATNLAQVARAVANTLLKEEEMKNKYLLIQSFAFTQNELLAALEKITGDKFERETVATKDFLAEHVPGSQKGEFEHMMNVVWAIGVTDSEFDKRPTFANKLLGLEEEDLETSLREALAKM